MKRTVLAFVATMAMFGAAYAQGISMTGSAEMGVMSENGDSAEFHQDVGVTFVMAGETGTGLTFGTELELGDEADMPSHYAVTIGGPFGNVTLGGTDGAFAWALAEVGDVGSLGDVHEHVAYSGNDGLDGGESQILRYDNSFGDFGVALSFEQESDVVGIGATGGFGYFALGVGYQKSDMKDIVGVSASTTFNGITGVVNYSTMGEVGMDGVETHTGVGATYTTGAVAIHANYGQTDKMDGMKASGFGVASSYDMGGGAAIKLGYGSSKDDMDKWSLGLAMSF